MVIVLQGLPLSTYVTLQMAQLISEAPQKCLTNGNFVPQGFLDPKFLGVMHMAIGLLLATIMTSYQYLSCTSK